MIVCLSHFVVDALVLIVSHALRLLFSSSAG